MDFVIQVSPSSSQEDYEIDVPSVDAVKASTSSAHTTIGSFVEVHIPSDAPIDIPLEFRSFSDRSPEDPFVSTILHPLSGSSSSSDEGTLVYYPLIFHSIDEDFLHVY
ncbi:hypothetical protein L1987_43409 [Smallanthus sonchifolius]|uniref:Uncharacterized protein n=1 Tax=Smallanthus sonchifolius TaxID=185202 RepID=A0ACB9GM89_9ASTR|nr:hypothetical protein L1987_43409 [Smallanthus sonchifolius]